MKSGFLVMVTAWFALGCGADTSSAVQGTGKVQVFVVPEDSIVDGLTAGSGPENVKDGWTVSYKRFLVAAGNFRAYRSSAPADRIEAKGVTVIDLVTAPASGVVLATFDGVTAARFDKVGFDLANASATSTGAKGLPKEDLDRMVQNGWSLYVEAELTKATGQSCPRGDATKCKPAPKVTIAWGVTAGTSYDDCAPEQGDSGFAVPLGGTVAVKPTIHGDHWFFTNVTHGAELTERRAQWIADCDLDLDGTVTLDELGKVKKEEVFDPAVYSIADASVVTARDYFVSQARTLGDFQGDGECPTRKSLP